MTSTDLSPASTRYTHSYKALVTVLLMLAYSLNSADRQLVAIIGQPMKVDLGLTDTQVGLLVGTAFAAFYAVSGLIVARVAERLSRVTIISIALTVWSALTMLYGAAANFTQLLVTRMGVGIGEAGCTPAAHSLISDYFDPSRRATALSVYSCGISVGYLLSAIVGGYVTLHYGWRPACMVLGLPGIAMAVAILRLVREPPRGNAEPRRAEPERLASLADHRSSQPRFGLKSELGELGSVARTLLLTWSVGNVSIGIIVSTFAAQGSWAFVPAFFKRAYPLDYGTVGLAVGLAGGVPVGIGLIAGGVLSDFIGARRARWYALVPALGLAVATPLYVLAFLQSDWQPAALLLAAAGLFQYVSFGPTFGIAQNVVEPHRRATATALIYVLLNVVALAFGPLFTGWLIDRLAEVNFTQTGASGWLDSLRAAWHVAPSGGLFQSMCPGGRPIAAASAATAVNCAAALAQASRQGIIVTVLIYAWAALHYLLGAIGLERMLRDAATRNAALAARS
jgi:MFS family permease